MIVYRIMVQSTWTKRVPLTDWLASREEAEDILAHTHPVLEPTIETQNRA